MHTCTRAAELLFVPGISLFNAVRVSALCPSAAIPVTEYKASTKVHFWDWPYQNTA